MFHTHYFKPSEKDPEMLYCYCGEVKDIHRHIWKTESYILGTIKNKIGEILRCEICGELKNHYL